MSETSRRGSNAKKKMPTAKLLFRVHSLLGLAAGLALLLVGTSGALLVFSEALDHVLFHELHTVVARGERRGYDELFEAARQRNPDAYSVRVRRFASAPDESVEILIGRSDRGEAVWEREYVDPYTGALLGERHTGARAGSSNPFGVVLALHANLLLGKPGRAVLAVLSLLMLSSVVTGALVYRRSIAQVLAFRVRLRRGNGRAVSSTAHRVVGVWSIAFNVVMALTGFWMARAALSPAYHRPAPAGVQPALTFSIDALLEEAQARAPQFVPRRMSHVGGSGEARLSGTQRGQAAWFSDHSSHVVFDARTGELERVALIGEAPLADKLEASVKPLHFGIFGGLWTQAAYTLAGLSLPLLSATGLIVWWRRRRGPRARRSPAAESAVAALRPAPLSVARAQGDRRR